MDVSRETPDATTTPKCHDVADVLVRCLPGWGLQVLRRSRRRRSNVDPTLERDSLNGKITLLKLENLATTSGNVISFTKHLGGATNI